VTLLLCAICCSTVFSLFNFTTQSDVLEEVIDKLANGLVKPHISQTIKFVDSVDVFNTIDTKLLGNVMVEIGQV